MTRVETISGDESRKAKIMARVESLHDHVTDIQREKQTVNEYLFSNNESVGRVQAEINRECDKSSGMCVSLCICRVCVCVCGGGGGTCVHASVHLYMCR